VITAIRDIPKGKENVGKKCLSAENINRHKEFITVLGTAYSSSRE
jgi:hypothetical protein